ncbi:MAG: LacI family DNA-binding transcriptional regulator [Verrucomicrobiota bacterium]
MPRPSLNDIAIKAGVSKMTVSRVLRNQRNVASGTREEVLAAAKKLGYIPDPQVTRLMQHLRSYKSQPITETIAFLWPDATRHEVATNRYLKLMATGAERRARELGFSIEHFWLADSGMTQRRVDKIFAARGIEGVIVGLLSHHGRMEIDLSWDRLCTVMLCEGHVAPPFHKVKHSHYNGMAIALREAAALGYQRIGLQLDEVLAKRLDHSYEASFLVHHPLGINEAMPLLLLKKKLSKQDFGAWIKETKPEMILSLECSQLRDWLRSISTPLSKKIKLAMLNWIDAKPDSDFMGVNQDFAQLAANAVDLITAHMLRNDHGIPASPTLVLSEGTWVPAGKRARKK